EYLITKRSVNLGKSAAWKRDRTSSQTVASGDFVNKTIVIEFVNQAAVHQLFNFDVRRFRTEQSHQPSDVAHSPQVRDRFPLDAGKIVLIPLFPHCRIAYLKPPHHSFDHDRFVDRRHAESQTLNQGHKDPLGSFRTFLQKLGMHAHSLVEDRNLRWLESGDGREALTAEPADQRAVEHRRIHSTRFQRMANQYRVADTQDIDVVAFWIEADILQRQHRMHPSAATHVLNAEALTAQLLDPFNAGISHDRMREGAGDRRKNPQIVALPRPRPPPPTCRPCNRIPFRRKRDLPPTSARLGRARPSRQCRTW